MNNLLKKCFSISKNQHILQLNEDFSLLINDDAFINPCTTGFAVSIHKNTSHICILSNYDGFLMKTYDELINKISEIKDELNRNGTLIQSNKITPFSYSWDMIDCGEVY